MFLVLHRHLIPISIKEFVQHRRQHRTTFSVLHNEAYSVCYTVSICDQIDSEGYHTAHAQILYQYSDEDLVDNDWDIESKVKHEVDRCHGYQLLGVSGDALTLEALQSFYGYQKQDNSGQEN